MLIQEYMTPDPVVMEENATIMAAAEKMKEKRIRRFPVVRDGQLIGIVTDRDLRSAAPSQVLSFDECERQLLPELHKLLSSVKVKDIMSRRVITVRPDQSLVLAAHLMLKNRISGMPVVSAGGQLVGIITQTDVFKILIELSGIHRGKTTFALEIEDRPGSIKEVADVIREHEGRLASILTTYDRAKPQCRLVYIRICDLPEERLARLRQVLEVEFRVLYVIQDRLEP